VVSQTHLGTVPAVVNFQYNQSGRVTQINYGAAGSLNYSYDSAGNVVKTTIQ
jgi:YD repeat-containing protein